MSERRYEPQEAHAARLIDKGVRVWQELQRLAMDENELFDSVVLLGQELWLPHHETDASLYGVTLRLAVHYPPGADSASEERAAAAMREIAARESDEGGRVTIQLEAHTRDGGRAPVLADTAP